VNFNPPAAVKFAIHAKLSSFVRSYQVRYEERWLIVIVQGT
jgi:hypothetical protein